jgi:hypothetical protein
VVEGHIGDVCEGDVVQKNEFREELKVCEERKIHEEQGCGKIVKKNDSNNRRSTGEGLNGDNLDYNRGGGGAREEEEKEKSEETEKEKEKSEKTEKEKEEICTP